MGQGLDFIPEGVAAERPADGFGLAQAVEHGRVGRCRDERGEVGDAVADGSDLGNAIVAAGEMGVDARPWPVLRPLGQAGAHRVEGDVTDGRLQMGLVHDHGAEPALPEMAGALQAGMDVAGIAAMHRGEGAAQPVAVRGHQDQVDMVGHQHTQAHTATPAARQDSASRAR